MTKPILPREPELLASSLLAGTISYLLLVTAAFFIIQATGLAAALSTAFPAAFASFALLVAPLWLFGFGAAEWLRQELPSSWPQIILAALLGIPYLVFAVATGHLRPAVCSTIFLLPVIAAWLMRSAATDKLVCEDGIVLGAVAAIQMSSLLASAWPYAGLAALPKLFLLDAVLYVYLVVRQLPGIGYSLVPTARAAVVGMREFVFFLPFGIGLGFALRFIHFHEGMPLVGNFVLRIALTGLFAAIPEEIFFRGILQNLLESRLGQTAALALASLLFGLAHFNKGAAFNWRYVILAAIAGVFYGRAWRDRRQVLSSVITHTAVDVVWSVWFR